MEYALNDNRMLDRREMYEVAREFEISSIQELIFEAGEEIIFKVPADEVRREAEIIFGSLEKTRDKLYNEEMKLINKFIKRMEEKYGHNS